MSDPLVISGFAARTGVRTELAPGVIEVIEPGAFRRSVMDPQIDVTLNLEHGRAGSGLPLARTRAGTLAMREVISGPETGLYVEATLDPDDWDAQLLARKLGNGSLQGDASFAFRVPKGGQRWEHFDTHSIRTLTEVNLAFGDVTCCTHGAYSEPRLAIEPVAAPVARSRTVIPNYTAVARREYEAMLRRS